MHVKVSHATVFSQRICGKVLPIEGSIYIAELLAIRYALYEIDKKRMKIPGIFLDSMAEKIPIQVSHNSIKLHKIYMIKNVIFHKVTSYL